MSSSVESRILTMKFENTAFKTGVESTLSMLGKLKTMLTGMGGTQKVGGLDTTGSAKGLSSLGAQADAVGNRFTAMGVVAATAIATIAHSALTAGGEMVKSLSVEPIMDGFREYELKMGSIQTILANTSRDGTKLEDVNRALDELNKYADKTIYNFGDMTKNIGRFTNAGIGLKDSVAMIKGFSNEAASSGTNSQAAAGAAMQLSQALNSGVIRAMDWFSITNAGMGSSIMRDGLIDIASAMGTFEGKSITAADASKNFKGSLEKEWLTAGVMTNYLKIQAGELNKEQIKGLGLSEQQATALLKQQKIAEDSATKVRTFTGLIGTLRESVASGWSDSFAIIFGDFNEATKLFTGVNNVIGGMFEGWANARNKMLRQWARAGGRDAAIDAIANAWEALMHILGPIGRAWRDVFPATTGKQLASITESIRDFTEGLIANKGTMRDIRTIFGAFFGILGVGWEIFKGLIHYVTSFIGLLAGGTGGLLDLSGSVAEVVKRFTDWILAGDYIKRFFDTVIAGRAAVFAPIIEAISKVASALAGMVSAGVDDLFDWIQSLAPMADKIQAFAASMQEMASTKVSAFFSSLQPYAADARDLAVAFAEIAKSKLSEFFSDISDGLSQVGPMFQGMGDSMRSAFGNLKGAAGGVSLGGIFDIGDETTVAEAGIKRVKTAIGDTTSVADMASAAWDKVVAAFSAVKDFLAPVGDAIGDAFGAIREKVGTFTSDLGIEEALALVNTGFFIAMYTTFTRFAKSLTGIAKSATNVLDGVSGNLKTMQTDVRSNIILKIAAALLLLSVSLLILSKIPAESLKNSLLAVAFLLTALVAALLVLEEQASLKGAISMTALSVSLVALGIAILALSTAVAILGQMDPAELQRGLLSVGLILAAVVTASAVLEKTGGARQILIASAAIGVLAISLVAFAGALKLYASLDTGMMLEGGLKVAAAIVAIGIAMQFMPKNMLATAAGLIIVSASLLIIAGALKAFGALSVEEMAKGLIMLGGSLLIIAVAMNAMSGAVGGAVAMLLFAGALAVLVPSIVVLGSLDISTIAIALGALAAIFVVLGLAGLILAPVVPVILALAIAMGIMGIAAMAVGGGLLLFSAGLAALAVTGTAGIAVLTAAIIGIAEIFPLIMHQFGLGLIALAKVIATAGPPLVKAFTTVLLSMIRAVIKVTPEFGKLLVVLIKTGLAVIWALTPQFIKTGLNILMALLRGVRSKIGDMTKTAVDIVVKFIQGVASRMERIVKAGVDLAVKFIKAVAKELASRAVGLVGDVIRIGGDIGSGLAKGLREVGGKMVDAAVDFILSKIPEKVKKIMGIASPSKVMKVFGGFIAQGLAIGISNGRRGVERSTEDVAHAALDTMRETLFAMSDVMTADMDLSPVVTPILDLTRMANEASKIGTMIDGQTLTAGVSLAQASSISDELRAAAEAAANSSDSSEPREIKFEQNNYSPEALSEAQIYRNTNNQISIAREVLKV